MGESRHSEDGQVNQAEHEAVRAMLTPGEQLLWVERPPRAAYSNRAGRVIGALIFGIVLIGFVAGLWFVVRVSASTGGGLPIPALIALGLVIAALTFAIVRGVRGRPPLVYALTERRALLIGVRQAKRPTLVEEYALDALPRLIKRGHPSRRAVVLRVTEHRTSSSDNSSSKTTYDDHGFLGIQDPDAVERLILERAAYAAPADSGGSSSSGFDAVLSPAHRDLLHRQIAPGERIVWSQAAEKPALVGKHGRTANLVLTGVFVAIAVVLAVGVWRAIPGQHLLGTVMRTVLAGFFVLMALAGLAGMVTNAKRLERGRSDVGVYAVTNVRALIAQQTAADGVLVVSFFPGQLADVREERSRDGRSRFRFNARPFRRDDFGFETDGFHGVERADHVRQALAALAPGVRPPAPNDLR